MQKHQSIPRKYRPQFFKDVIGQDPITQTLKNALKYNQISSGYLFCGPRGVGKTTVARIFAKALNCSSLSDIFEPCNECQSCLEITRGASLDVIEIDGASNRGIDDIRQINDTVGYCSSSSKYKIYIIDEVHMLTKEAFNALLKTLEEPPEMVKFFFATTEPHKIISTVLSRCLRFDLKRISTEMIVNKLQEITQSLQREATQNSLELVASYSEGSLRDAETIFEKILCFEENQITEESVQDCLGLIPKKRLFDLDKAMDKQDMSFPFQMVDEIFHKGLNLQYFFDELLEHFRCLLCVKKWNQKPLNSYVESAQLYSLDQLLFILDYLLHTGKDLIDSSKRVTLEMILFKIILSKQNISISSLFQRLIELEKKHMQPSEDVKELKSTHTQQQSSSKTLELKKAPCELSKNKPTENIPFSRHETLMRFAAVELEGSLNIEK